MTAKVGQTNSINWRTIPLEQSLSVNQFFRQYQAKNCPVVIENGVPAWKAFARWTPEYFARCYGEKQVIPDSHSHVFYGGGKQGEAFSIRHLVHQVMANNPTQKPQYLRNMDIYNQFPEIANDIEPRLPHALPNWMACRLLPQFVPDGLVELFIGGAGAGFPKLHYDTHGSHAYIVQIYGSKDIFAIPPSQTELLTQVFGDPEKFSVSAADPRLGDLEAYKVNLKPGQLLFVPNGWWHTTHMGEPSISISTNNVNRSNWNAYVAEMVKGRSGLRALARRTALHGLGLLLTMSGGLMKPLLFRPYPKAVD